MAGLEAVLRISAKDDAGPALTKVKEQIAQLDKGIAVFDKMALAVGKVSKSTDPMLVAINASVRAMNEARGAAVELASGLEAMGGGAEAAAGGQRTLGAAIMSTTRLMAVQGVEAVKVAEKIALSQKAAARRTREGGGAGLLAGLAPLAAGEGLVKAIESGASVQDEIARLKAAGATDSQIGKARSDFSEFSKTHSGVLESEYLAGFKDARVIAPGEQFEMAGLAARYRAAARNSGVSTSDNDVGNVLRIMDELGLKSNPEREDFLNNFLKSQQAFGSQISSETALAAYRNAKQSIYDWSPEFRNKYFPTLLQSSGQQGGTEMMTALNNYIGQHMQQSELRALAAAGFVGNQDLITNKVGDVKGLKPGAQLFEADLFKKNIAQWAWDFHDTFMKRKGATEDQFGTLIDRMPRNMAALIAFLNHNRGRLQRDAASLDLPAGLKAEGNEWLGQNPGAELAALGSALEQFGAVVTGPAIKAAGPALLALTQDIQAVAATLDKLAKEHPTAAAVASAGGIGAVGAGILAGAWKIGSGIWGKIFGGGGAAGGEAAAAGGGAAAAGGGWLSGLGGLGAALGLLIGDKSGNAGIAAILKKSQPDWSDQDMKDWSNAQLESIRESARGHALMNMPGPPMALPGGMPASPIGAGITPYGPTPPQVSVSGEAHVDHQVTITINPSPLLQAIVDQARQGTDFTVPLIGGGNGRMDSDAAPHRGGIGHQ
jgi:hypothetical protein